MIDENSGNNLLRKLFAYLEVRDAEFQFPFSADSAPLVGRDRIVDYLRVKMARDHAAATNRPGGHRAVTRRPAGEPP